ncbi:MAG TPA: 6-carboxytetrahydropterin synthase [Geobacterales bacterium]|nr:6-carboxytetrahydropterin synthase [Geobacterales bacterium]
MTQSRTGIFIEDDFDYAHFIPGHPKCFPLHGHTARLEIRILGSKRDFDMIIDFGELRSMVKRALSSLDHKLIVSRKYVKRIEDGLITVEYSKFSLKIPIEHVYIMDSEVTTENLSEEICKILLNYLPENIENVEVNVYEGNRKGAFSNRARE